MARTIMDIAGDAIEAACRLEKRQPTALVVTWAFSFASALVLFREGFAKRASVDAWAMHETAIDQLWPEIEKGLFHYLRSAEDVSDFTVPTRDEFFRLTVPSSLAVASDVRLTRHQEPDDLLAVLIERFGSHLSDTPSSEVRLMVYVAKRLFNTVGLVDPGE